jgi:hypothetical protein
VYDVDNREGDPENQHEGEELKEFHCESLFWGKSNCVLFRSLDVNPPFM